MANTEQLLYQAGKSSHRRFSIKNSVFKIFAIFMENTLREIFKNTYFEEHLRTAASELNLPTDCLELCFWIAFKTIWTQ